MKRRTPIPLAFIMFMLFLVPVHAQIPNNGFENWVTESNDTDPEGWLTTNNDPYLSVTPYTPAYMGEYSMSVATFYALNMTFPGTATAEFAYAQRPEVLNACIKTNIMPGDRALLIVAFYKNGSVIALPEDCTFSIDSTISEFTCFSFPISYSSSEVPDTARIVVIAGSDSPQTGTEIIVDELSFSLTTRLEDKATSTEYHDVNFPNPARDFTYIPVDLDKSSDVEILLWDMKGAQVRSTLYRSMEAGRHELLVNTEQLPGGIYMYAVKTEDNLFFQKMSVYK